jgi:hypothetical protein
MHGVHHQAPALALTPSSSPLHTVPAASGRFAVRPSVLTRQRKSPPSSPAAMPARLAPGAPSELSTTLAASKQAHTRAFDGEHAPSSPPTATASSGRNETDASASSSKRATPSKPTSSPSSSTRPRAQRSSPLRYAVTVPATTRAKRALNTIDEDDQADVRPDSRAEKQAKVHSAPDGSTIVSPSKRQRAGSEPVLTRSASIDLSIHRNVYLSVCVCVCVCVCE